MGRRPNIVRETDRMNTSSHALPHPASFRDPSGFVLTVNGVFYRQVNRSYAAHYEELMRSGLYDTLTGKGLLLPHTETNENFTGSPDHYKTLLPQQLIRVSYAAEWSPEQLKDAALLTLTIQQTAMEYGMSLKDATPLNIQFDKGAPVFIDTLSFESYDPSRPWIAYRQFCECFLFPLYLHRYGRMGTACISATWPEGIPAAVTARLLPPGSRWNAGAWMHVFLQTHIRSDNPRRAAPANASQAPAPAGKAGPSIPAIPSFSKTKLTNLVRHLSHLVSRLNPERRASSAWSSYYSGTILGQTYLDGKLALFRQYLRGLDYSSALDLGCNDGLFSRILAEKDVPVLAVDADWVCIQRLYKSVRDRKPGNILPLCIDLANPTPASGFRNAERSSFTERARADLVLALALIHHLSLGKNIPLTLIAAWFSELVDRYLIAEFIPLSDPKAGELTARRTIPPAHYDQAAFEAAFSRYFRIGKKDPLPGSERTLYLLIKIDAG